MTNMRFSVPIRRSLLMGAFCCPVGVVVGCILVRMANGDGWEMFPWYAGTAAFLAPATVWWFLVEKKQLYSVLRGSVAGALGAVTAHYLCWYLEIICYNINFWLFADPGSSLEVPPIDPLNGFWGALVFSIYSYLFVGWITIPIGSLIGGIYASGLKR